MSVAKFSESSLFAGPSLQRKIEGRSLRSFLLTCLTWVSALMASIP